MGRFVADLRCVFITSTQSIEPYVTGHNDRKKGEGRDTANNLVSFSPLKELKTPARIQITCGYGLMISNLNPMGIQA